LGVIKILPSDFALRLAPCTGMRNRLVHEYDQINDRIVFDSIPKLLEMVDQYINYLRDYIEN